MLRGDRLRELRLSQGYTHESMAERLNLSVKQVWRYEAGETDPSGEVVSRMAKVFSVSADYLLDLTDSPNPNLGQNDLTAEERHLIAVLRRGQKLEAIKAIVLDS